VTLDYEHLSPSNVQQLKKQMESELGNAQDRLTKEILDIFDKFSRRMNESSQTIPPRGDTAQKPAETLPPASENSLLIADSLVVSDKPETKNRVTNIDQLREDDVLPDPNPPLPPLEVSSLASTEGTYILDRQPETNNIVDGRENDKADVQRDTRPIGYQAEERLRDLLRRILVENDDRETTVDHILAQLPNFLLLHSLLKLQTDERNLPELSGNAPSIKYIH
jgi:hypothetical protein